MENLTFYKEMLDNLPAIVYVNQIDDLNNPASVKNIYLNPLASSYLSQKQEEIDQLGNRLLLTIIHPDDLAAGLDSIRYSNKKTGDTFSGFHRILYNDGEYHWNYGYIKVIEMKDGKPWKFLNCMIDIDKQLQSQEQFHRLLKDKLGHKEKISFQSLTNREKEITTLITHGKTDKEIGILLFISDKTAKTHRNNILRKLKLRNTAELVRFIVENHSF